MGRTQLFCRRKLACRLPRYIHTHNTWTRATRQHQEQLAASKSQRDKPTPNQLPLFFLFPPRLGEKSAVELPVPTRTSAAGESHGRRYTVALKPGPPCPAPQIHPQVPVRDRALSTHMAFFQPCKRIHWGEGRASGRAREWDASAGSDPLAGKFTRPGRGGGGEG